MNGKCLVDEAKIGFFTGRLLRDFKANCIANLQQGNKLFSISQIHLTPKLMFYKVPLSIYGSPG